MRWVDVKESIKDFWFEFRRQKGGLLGLFLLALLVFTAIAAPYITEPDIPEKWKTVWVDNPQAVPPVWYNYLTTKSLSPHEVFGYRDVEFLNHGEDIGGGIRYYSFVIVYNYQYSVPPKDIIIKGIQVKLGDLNTPANIIVSVERPDNQKLELLTADLVEGSVYQLGKNKKVRESIINWALKYEKNKDLDSTILDTLDVMKLLFSQATSDILENPKPLNGQYKFYVEVYTFNNNDKISFNNMKVIFAGRTYGLMGTDTKGRDLWAGLVWGTRVSLVVGISVAVLSVLIGIAYGVTSAYLGGWKDEFMQRVNEFVASIPTLPILILLGTAFKGHTTLWTIVFLLVMFGWTGIAKVARSMALQIKEQTYVEAAKALGAGTGRIIFKHIMPQIMPYAFAVVALSVPGAVLTEASLSYLGLGDPTAVTWGQILHDAQVNGATINGYWWWVIPPGLAISLVALTFVLIGVALDRVLNPRLRRL